MKDYRIFISYSKDALKFKEDLVRHLDSLRKRGKFEVWHDALIQPGERWEEEISDNIRNCDCAILLLSPDFLRSDFIEKVELKAVLERYDQIDIFPIYTMPCVWSLIPELRVLQIYPPNIAISQIPLDADQDDTWKTIVEKLNELSIKSPEKRRPRVN